MKEKENVMYSINKEILKQFKHKCIEKNVAYSHQLENLMRAYIIEDK